MPIAAKGDKLPAVWWAQKLKFDGQGPNDLRVSKNFSLDEFESPDTREVILNARGLKLLQALRDDVGLPIMITSGYRTAGHNSVIGGAKYSFHMKGEAWDIIIYWKPGKPRDPDYPGLYDRRALGMKAIKVGFGTVIVYTSEKNKRSCVHCDIRTPEKGLMDL